MEPSRVTFDLCFNNITRRPTNTLARLDFVWERVRFGFQINNINKDSVWRRYIYFILYWLYILEVFDLNI
jgi:hypothetical protein